MCGWSPMKTPSYSNYYELLETIKPIYYLYVHLYFAYTILQL